MNRALVLLNLAWLAVELWWLQERRDAAAREVAACASYGIPLGQMLGEYMAQINDYDAQIRRAKGLRADLRSRLKFSQPARSAK